MSEGKQELLTSEGFAEWELQAWDRIQAMMKSDHFPIEMPAEVKPIIRRYSNCVSIGSTDAFVNMTLPFLAGWWQLRVWDDGTTELSADLLGRGIYCWWTWDGAQWVR